jgi:Family of unknown function (DUF5330)
MYGDVSKMMFLLRLAFWILVICLLLPGPPQDNQRLLTSAEKTVADVRGFCGRNPDVCDNARGAMTSMLAKLKNGADFLQTWLAQDSGRRPEGGRLFPVQPAPDKPAHTGVMDQPVQAVPRWGDSLNQSDRLPPWRGPA